jgi:hypothetical protein
VTISESTLRRTKELTEKRKIVCCGVEKATVNGEAVLGKTKQKNLRTTINTKRSNHTKVDSENLPLFKISLRGGD